MLQLTVYKQGKNSLINWHKRKAIFDSAQQCIFLDRYGHANDACHHKFFLKRLSLWPNYDTLTFKDSHTLNEEVLTVLLSGEELPVTDEDRRRVIAFKAAVREGAGRTSRSSTPERAVGDGSCSPGAVSAEEHGSSHGDGHQSRETAPALTNTETKPPSDNTVKFNDGEWYFRCQSIRDLQYLVDATRTLQHPEGSSARATSSTSEDIMAAAAGPSAYVASCTTDDFGGASPKRSSTSAMVGPGGEHLHSPGIAHYDGSELVPHIVGDVAFVQDMLAREKNKQH